MTSALLIAGGLVAELLLGILIGKIIAAGRAEPAGRPPVIQVTGDLSQADAAKIVAALKQYDRERGLR